MSSLKRTLLTILTSLPCRLLYRPLMRGRASIFMLHRFQDPERGVEGDDPHALRSALAELRRQRCELISLGEVFRRLAGEGPPLDRAVAFTIDDGFLEQATVAGPVFAEFDCPVTTFVCTGFLDHQLWFWWNQIEHAFGQSRRRSVELALGERTLRLAWEGPAQLRAAQDAVTLACKLVPDEEKLAAIRRLAAALEVELPSQPPARYAPMSWEQLRQCERRGMSFGPHTLTHPILSRTGDAQSRAEIEGSWKRLQAEAAQPLPIFCYPNGGWSDFGAREMATLRQLGFRGAVSGVAGYADAGTFACVPEEKFKIRRFSYHPDYPYLAQCVCGLERLKEVLGRGEAA
jgi:peptidoglycan/xylan/chitin deacetylase (PgdA/CDA1 family)